MPNSDASSSGSFLVYLLPFLHLGACVTIWAGHIDSGWQKLIIVDFPFSIVIVGLLFRSDNPLLAFGVLGTFWWYGLSLFIRWLFRSAGSRNV
jgi:hypothetical protein